MTCTLGIQIYSDVMFVSFTYMYIQYIVTYMRVSGKIGSLISYSFFVCKQTIHERNCSYRVYEINRNAPLLLHSLVIKIKLKHVVRPIYFLDTRGLSFSRISSNSDSRVMIKKSNMDVLLIRLDNKGS